MFGAEMVENQDKILDILLARLAPYFATEPRITSVQAEMLLRKIYLAQYGLVDPVTLNQNPTVVVSHRIAEDARYGSLKDDYLKSYMDLEIFSLVGISYPDYMTLPRVEIDRIRKEAEARRKMKNTIEANGVDRVEKHLGRALFNKGRG